MYDPESSIELYKYWGLCLNRIERIEMRLTAESNWNSKRSRWSRTVYHQLWILKYWQAYATAWVNNIYFLSNTLRLSILNNNRCITQLTFYRFQTHTIVGKRLQLIIFASKAHIMCIVQTVHTCHYNTSLLKCSSRRFVMVCLGEYPSKHLLMMDWCV